jgi:hypothetical protein
LNTIYKLKVDLREILEAIANLVTRKWRYKIYKMNIKIIIPILNPPKDFFENNK